MGIRCLLGHEYANREVEREREERGDEVVVTYRTVETCDRCGERRVISENKEVRPIRNPREEDVTTELGGAGATTPDLGGPGADDTEPADAAVSDATGDDTAPRSESEPGPTAPGDGGADAEGSAAEPDPAAEDAVILGDGTDDDDDTDRGHGEWPAADVEAPTADGTAAVPGSGTEETTVGGGDGWPDPRGDDEGFDAEPADGEPANISFGGGLTPEAADEAATNGTERAVAGKQFVAAESVEPVGEESTGETEFFCPNCGFARVVGGSSMRAGDICPDCHKGYIAERER
jgi:hypothetical protein